MENIESEVLKLDEPIFNYIEEQRLFPIVKWAGGKELELKYIMPRLPQSFVDYFEPFVGGGAVYTSIQAERYFINDKSTELIELYNSITNDNRNSFFQAIDAIIHNWEVLTNVVESNSELLLGIYKSFSEDELDETKLKDKILEFILADVKQFNGMFSTHFNHNIEHFIKEMKINLVRKIKRMKVLESNSVKLEDSDILDNIETALKSAFYMHFRYLYNNGIKYDVSDAFRSAIFYFIRNYAYSGMFRYNLNGNFNVPYGGMAYNRKNFEKKVDYLKTSALQILLEKTMIKNLDFEDFFRNYIPKSDDFIFLDPPYDSEFSSYSQNVFDGEDQVRLANYLIHECRAKWMMIIKKTDFIHKLYNRPDIQIETFDKTYGVSFMNRNERKTQHLIITNY